jgi:NarL family two-component system response regulator YdfI
MPMGKCESKKISLLIANDHQIIQDGLVSLLSGDPTIELVGQTTSISTTIRLIGEREPDVLLIDPTLPDQDGWRAIELIHGEWPQVAIIVFTNQLDHAMLLRLLRVGICAYLTLRTERAILLQAIHTAAGGNTTLQPEHVGHLLSLINESSSGQSAPTTSVTSKREVADLTLTVREREILHRVAHGDRNKEIAARLMISEPTVKSHLASAYYKLGVDSRASAVAIAIERGILSLAGQPSRVDAGLTLRQA